jgi:cell division protease FtsH
MALDAWLPIGFKLPDGAKARFALFEGADWQILRPKAVGGRSLCMALAQRWLDAGLIDDGTLSSFEFGDQQLRSISCGPSQTLCPVTEAKSPDNKAEALAFALALKATRDIDPDSALQDALYVEKITRLLPTYSISSEPTTMSYSATG